MKQFLAFALMLFAIVANAADYPIWIKGVQITDSNKQNVLGDGTVRYQDSNNMLIFTNANITYDGSVITIESNMTKDLEMKFIGANTFTSTNSHGIYHGGTGKLTIWSDEYNYGSLTINATTSGKIGIDLANKADVKINRLDLTVNAGSTAIASHFAPTTEVLTISNSNAKLHGERSAVKMKKVDLAFCQYESSYGIDGFNSEGRGTLAGKVQTDVKVKEDVYDIQVAGKKVTAKNARNILLDNNYSVYYDARENMLTLENANITTNANNAIHINSFQKTNDKAFKIRLIGKTPSPTPVTATPCTSLLRRVTPPLSIQQMAEHSTLTVLPNTQQLAVWRAVSHSRTVPSTSRTPTLKVLPSKALTG